MTPTLPTAQFASVVYGDDVALDDPAELFHEAAKLYPSVGLRQGRAIGLLARDAELQQSIDRAARRYSHRPRIDLPPPLGSIATLEQVIQQRSSRPPAAESTIGRSELAALLAAANGVREDEPRRRAVPSGGALYPLELYVVALKVDETPAGVYHFDPYAGSLEELKRGADEVARALIDPSIAENAAAFLAVTGVFWRTRFKYGLRGYRFALLEAGHAMQNALLVATALGLAALPLGGFYDTRVEALLGVDGVEESILYLAALGRP